MTRLFVTAFILMISVLSFGQTPEEKIDNLISRYVDYRLFNGTVLVADESGVIFKKGYGFANMEWNIPNKPDVKFRLGSITKQFTAMLIMQLVQEGKIELDKKITDYLPYYRKETGDKVTIHHLLTHSSGIPSYTSRPDFIPEVSRKYYAPDDFVKAYCSGDFDFEPGTQFSYNNSGYFILGAIIEKLTGKSYQEVLKQRIFDPLEMSSSGYDISETILDKRAAGYERDIEGFRNTSFLDMSLPYSAGSLYSTVEDLYKWDRALYTNKLLKQEFKDVYFKPHMDALGGNYAYGWFIFKNKTLAENRELELITHGGGINGFNTLISRLTDDKKLVVLLNNTGGTALNDIANSIFSILYGKEPQDPKKPISLHLGEIVQNDGIDEAVDEYRRIRNEESDKYDMKESELNSLGYYFLNRDMIDEAAAIFALNIEAYPEAFNTYDSMGEVLMKKGNNEEAIANYKKSLELNPRNTNAVKMLKTMGVDADVHKDAVVAAKVLKLYEGKYELQKDFIITITEEGGKIFAQATGQPKFEIFPESETRFYFKVVNAQIEFNKNDKGSVTGLTLFQNGREMPAKKID